MLSGLRVAEDEAEWPLSSVFKANSCVIVSRAWENVPSAAGRRDLTPEPLVKETCVLPDSIMMLMTTSTLLNLMLTFFPFSFLNWVFFPPLFFYKLVWFFFLFFRVGEASVWYSPIRLLNTVFLKSRAPFTRSCCLELNGRSYISFSFLLSIVAQSKKNAFKSKYAP